LGSRIESIKWETRYQAAKRWERFLMFIAWKLPKVLVKWCYVRVAAHATQGKYGSTIVPEISMMDALKRWDE